VVWQGIAAGMITLPRPARAVLQSTLGNAGRAARIDAIGGCAIELAGSVGSGGHERAREDDECSTRKKQRDRLAHGKGPSNDDVSGAAGHLFRAVDLLVVAAKFNKGFY
jgi:hypothetical protein